jgi:hypothetical protein
MVRRSTLSAEKLTNVRSDEMIVISIGYRHLVLNHKDAFLLSEILARVEAYESKYRGNGAENTHHVYPNEEQYTMQVISEDLYRMAKLAGKPAKEV